MGGDCTNFVSISLSQGGLAENGDWYLKYKRRKGEKRVFRPSNSSEFNYWYTAKDPSSWISAPKFEEKFSGAFPNMKVNAGEYHANYSTRKRFYSQKLYKGDVIQVLEPHFWWKRAYHTMIITGYEPEEGSFSVSYHTADKGT